MTREIPLTRGLIAFVDDEDFERISAFKWRAKRPTPACKTFYAVTWQYPNEIQMHNMVLPPLPGHEIDHRDRSGLNNTRKNLRQATRAQNMANRSFPLGRAGYRGVTMKGSRYRASVTVDGRQRMVGSFKTAIEAAVAYDRATAENHGEFASLNFSPNRDWLFPHEHVGTWPPAPAD